MILLKKIFLLFFLFFLSSCAPSSSAFLAPIFTGAKTGSIAQASLSYGSNIIINDIRYNDLNNKNKKLKNTTYNFKYVEKNPIILVYSKIDQVDVSEILEPEPLP